MVKEAGPTFIKKPSLNQSDDGRILTFSCQIAGEPRPNFKWILGDKEIKSGGRYRSNVKKLGDGYQVTLEIEDVSADDAGSYKIVADNKFGNTSATIALKFGDTEEEDAPGGGQTGVDGIAPNFTMKPKMKQSPDGANLNIETELCADPEPEIKWYIGDKILKDGGRLKLLQRKDGEFFFLTLQITDVSEDDGGEYKIIAKNKLGSATNTIKLNFARGGGAPSFTMKPRIDQSDDGRKLSFHCELTADPQPELTWFKGDKQLSPGPRHKMSVKASEGKGFYEVDLNITDVSTQDGGNYKVVAKNEHGEAKSTIELNFEAGEEEPMDTSEPAPSKPAPADKKQRGPGAPQFLDKPSMRQADDGHRVTFECQLTAVPDPEVTWYRNTDIIKDKGRWRITQSKKKEVFTQSLVMNRVTPDDSGTYICYAKNKAGDDKAIINLNFDVRQASTEGAPTFIEQPNIKQEDDGHRLVMEVKVLADPEPEITWHFNNLELRNRIPYKIRQSKQGTKVYICVLEVANITQKDQGNYKVVAENNKGKASSTMSIKFEVKDYKKPRNFTLSHQVAPMQVDFVTPMEFEFGPEGPIKVGGGFNLQKAEFADMSEVSSDGLVKGEIPFEMLPNRAIEEGEPAAMKCKVGGKIKDFKWFKDGKQIRESKEIRFIRKDDFFEIEFMNVKLKDIGSYELVTDGPKGKKHTKCEMKVIDPTPATLKRREAEKKKKEEAEKKKKEEEEKQKKAEEEKKKKPEEEKKKKAEAEKKKKVEEEKKKKVEEEKKKKVEEEKKKKVEEEKKKKVEEEKKKKVEEEKKKKVEEEKKKKAEEEKKKEPARKPGDKAPAGKEPVEEPPLKKAAGAPVEESAPPPKSGEIQMEIPIDEPITQAAAPTTESAPPAGKAPVEEAVTPSKAPAEESKAPGKKAPIEEGSVKKKGEIIKKKPAAKKEPAPTKPKDADSGGAPYFVESPSGVEVPEGHIVMFEAKVEGDPKPTITWYKGPTAIKDGFRGRYVLKYNQKTNTHSLEIKKIEKMDKGKFSCKCENENGKDERVFALTVKDKPPSDELDFRSKLKKRSVRKEAPKEQAAPDWGTLKEVEGEEKVCAEITAPMKKTIFVAEREGRLILDVGAKWEGCKPTWFKNGKEIKADKKNRIKVGKNETSLIVSNITAKDDSAMYKCSFDKLAHSSCKVTVEPHRNLATISTEEYTKLVAQGREPKGGTKPKVDFVTLLKSVEVHEGADAKFTCELSGDALKMEWLHKDLGVPKDPKKYETKRLGRRVTLIIKNCQASDIGEIGLRIEQRDSTAQLNVKTKPKFLKELQPVVVVEKDPCAMECEISDMSSKVKWMKGTSPVTMSDRISEQMDGTIRRLIFEKADFKDAGEYVCKFETIQSAAKLSVDEPPKFGTPLDPVKEAFAGEDAVFETDVTSPAAEVFWFKDGEPLEPSDKYEIISDGLKRKLIVHDCKPEDRGRYACAMDDERKTFSDLGIQAPPTVDVPEEMRQIVVKKGDPAEISLGLDGSPPPEVKWKKDGVPVVPDERIQKLTMPDNATLLVTNTGLADGGEYEVAVTNKHGTVTEKVQITIIDIPGAPDSIKVRAYDETWIKVGWEPPSDTGNCEINHYVLEYKEGKRGDWQEAPGSGNVPDTEFTVPNLTTGKEYWFRVAAVNDVGQSEFVATDAGQEAKEPCEPPDQMTAPEIVETHDGEITVAWDPPEFDGGKPIQGYVLEKREPGGRWSKATKEPIKGTEHTVDKLPVGSPFEFRVAAVNKAGPSEPSAPSKVAKAREPIDPASAPGTPVVGDVTKDSVDLSWEKPSTEGGAPIEGYHVEKKNPDTGDWERVNDKPIKDTKYKVPDLKEGEETAFRVVAENEAGMSEPSEATPDVVVKDPEIPPSIDLSKMKDVTVKAGQNFKLAAKFSGFPPPTAKWSKADEELSPSDRVKIRGNGQETELTQLDSEREDSGVYSLTCENAFGKETATCNVTVLDIPKPPKGPLEVKDVYANSCVLSWEPPEDDGGQPLTNYVIEKRDASRTSWSVVNDTTKECTIKVPKLVEGVHYLFRVAAENSLGVSRFLEADKPTLAKNPYDEPGAPGTPEIADWDTDFVEIEWEEPEDDGGAPIDGYIIERKEKKSRNWVQSNDKPVKGTKFKVPKLVEGREYEFRVSAVNKAGQGKASEVSQPKLVKPKFAKPYLKGERLRDINVKTGNKFELALGFDGSPPPTVIWTRDGEEVKASDHVEITNEDENSLVKVKESVRGDSGEYEIALTNDSGTCKAKCRVNVLGKPSECEGPLEATDITQDGCKLTWNPPKDNGGSDITNYVVEKKEVDDDYWTKVTGFCQSPHCAVGKLEKKKEYVFRVFAENGHGDVSPPLESTLILARNPYDEPDAPGKPEILSYDRDRAELSWAEPISDGGDKITGYTVEKKEPKANRWTKCNKSPIIGNKHTVTGLYEGKQFEFRVIAENRAGPSAPSEPSEIMTAKPMFEPPKVDFGPGLGAKDVKVRAGEPFDIKIPFKGSPPPTAYWYKDNKEIRATERMKPNTEEEKTVLDCKKAERADTGVYKVTLENNQGSDNCSLNVIVLDKPTQPVGPMEYSEFTRDSVKLHWKAPEDDGNGTISGYIVEKCDANRDNWTKITSAAPVSGYVVQDLNEGHNYCFRVSAVNQYGVSEPLEGKQVTVKLPFDEPDSPSTPVVEEVDKNSAKISWNPPEDDGGSPVTGYIVEVKDPATGKWNKANNYPIKGTSYEVPNLEEGNEYQFRVIAENEAGPGKPSRGSEAVIAKQPILPADAPGRCKVDKVKKDNVALSWKKPIDDGGAPITDYVVQKRTISPSGNKGDWEDATKVPAKETSAVVPDLQEGEKYEFRVAAVNESGPGKFTPPTQIVTAEDKPEAPMLDISSLKDIKVKGGEKIEIKLPFTGVPVPNITWTLNGEPVKEENIRNTAESTTITVPSATIFDAGRYMVTLKNPSGQDTAKCKVQVLDAPDPPQGPVRVSDITPESCTVSWKPPKVGAEEVENYIVEKKDGESGQWRPVTSFCANTHCKIRNLTPGEEYQFRIMAQNPYGVSKPLDSEPIVAKHPFDAPGAPEAPEAKETDRNSITIGWHQPHDDGGSPITGYTVEKREAGTSKWVPVTRAPIRDTTCTAPKLVEGNEYEFRVKAVNAAGEGKPSETSEAITAQPPPVRPKIPLDSRHKEVTALAGDQYKVEIPFEASPLPKVVMTKDDLGNQEIPMGDRQKMESGPGYFTLVNTFAERDDTGKYTVTLNNPEGSDKCTIRVTVVDKPGPPEGPLAASDIMADSCKLSWKPPKDDGGSKITNYIVEMKEDNRPNWSKVSSFVRTPKYEIGELDEGTMYNFRVRAENEYGISEPLGMSFPVMAKNPYDRPDKPGKPEITDVDKGFVHLSWSPPEFDGGSRILGYNVEKRDQDFDWAPANDFLVKDTQLSLSNLQSVNTYEFRVLAKNAAGWSPPSKPSESVIPKEQFTTADKPGTPHATDVGKNSVDLAWTKPVDDGGSPIKGYTVEKREKGNPNWEKANTYPVRECKFTVPDLEPGKDYEFRVIPLNAAGEGQPGVTDKPISTRPAQVGKAPFFEKKLSPQTAGEGAGVKFEVVVSGFPEPDIRWFRAGVEIFPSNRQRMRKQDETASLTLEDLKEPDAGEYVCEASNKHGTEKCRAKLQVELAPEISRQPKDLTVEATNPFKVKIPFKGTGNVAAKCSKDGEPIHENDRMKLTVFDDYVLLNVKDAKPEDAGAFKIAIENDVGGDFSSFNVTVLDRPSPCKGPLDVSNITDHTLTLAWKPPATDGGSPIKSFVVQKKEEGKDWHTVGSYVKGSPYSVHGLTRGNTYLFRVAAENDIGQSDWLEGDGPIVAKNPFDPPGAPGTPDVEEIGKNFVSLAWTRPAEDGGSPITGYDIEKAEAGTDRWVKCNAHPVMQLVYNVPNLIEDRKYEFRIFGVNKAGRGQPSSASNSVTVKDPYEVIRPKFEQPLQDQTAVQGRKVTFECTFSGKPKPDIRWFKGPRELYNSDKILMTVEGELATLTISDLFGEDHDEYSCELENPGGKKISRAQLTIKCPPKIKVPPRFRDIVAEFSKGDQIKIKVPISGLPKPESSWSKEGQSITRGVEATDRHTTITIDSAKRSDTGAYLIKAENEIGTDDAVIKISVNDAPGPVTNVRAQDVTYDSVELTWQAPTDDGGGSPSFIVDKREHGSEIWSRAASTGMSKATLQMLTPGVEYSFRVKADNMYGTSEAVEIKHTIRIPEPKKPKKYVEEEEEVKPKKPKLPKVSDYDMIVEEGFTPTKVKLSNRDPLSKYIFGEELGRGPYGVILRAQERATGRNFAAKFIDVEPGDADHIRKEIETHNHLQHPRLAQMHDAFETTDPNQFVLIYDFMSGGDAFQRAGQRDHLTEAEVALYTRQVLQGLNYIHTRNHVHLDLKPQAVLYETQKGDALKIIDLGLATKLDPDERTKVVYKSTDYAAPETLEGGDVGFNTDMWTVGVLAYMLLSGIHPFDNDEGKIKRAAFEFDASAFRPISDEAKDFISKLLVRDKNERMAAHEALEHPWLMAPDKWSRNRIPTDNHRKLFLAPGWLYGEHNILGIGRLGDTSSHRRNRPQEKDYSRDLGMDRRDCKPRFIKKPREGYAMEDRDIHFECQIAAVSTPLVTWQRDGKELKQSLKFKTKQSDITYNLHISKLTLEDAGSYTVHAKNSFGEASHTFNLQVSPDPLKQPLKPRVREKKIDMPVRADRKPNFDFSLRPRSLQENDSVRLSCIAGGYPEPKVVWLHNGKEIEKVHPDFKQTFAYRLAVLELDCAKLEHAGVYTCVAENTKGTVECECRITVSAKDARRGRALLTERSSKTSKSSDYSSESSTGRSSRRSRRTEEEVEERSERKSTVREPSPEPVRRRREPSPEPVREPSPEPVREPSPEPEPVIESAEVQVQEETPPPAEPEESEPPPAEEPVENELPAEESGYQGPVISQKPDSVTTVEGKSAVFSCTLADSADSVEWLFGDRQLEDGGRFVIAADGATYTMEIPMALETDSGDYTLKAKNSSGECQANFSLQVSVEE